MLAFRDKSECGQFVRERPNRIANHSHRPAQTQKTAKHIALISASAGFPVTQELRCIDKEERSRKRFVFGTAVTKEEALAPQAKIKQTH